MIVPLSGRSMQPIRFSSVVFPLPEGPESTVNRFGSMTKLMSRSAGTSTASMR